MDIWIILIIISFVFLIIEMLTPTMFFINLAVATACTAIFAFFGVAPLLLTIIFSVVAIVTIAFVRPILLKQMNEKKCETGLTDKYIGKKAKVVQTITKDSGRVSIYGEEWNAKLLNEDVNEVAIGEDVEIVSNDSIIFMVKKI